MIILLVEDDEVNRLVMKAYLTRLFHKVIVAPNGKDALDKFRSQPNIDLIITDIMMPLMDGVELLKKIREGKKHPHIPIIGFTAGTVSEYTHAALPHSFNQLLTKPIKLAELSRKIKETVEDHGSFLFN